MRTAFEKEADMVTELLPCPFCGGVPHMYGGRVRDYVDGEWAKGEREEFWVKPVCADITCPVAIAWAHGYGIVDGIRFESPEAAAANWNKRMTSERDTFLARFGMTPNAAARVMSNFQGIMREFVDEKVFAYSSGSELWTVYAQECDIDITDGERYPSSYFDVPDGVVLFKKLISNGTYHGGMTSAMEAMREMEVRL